MNAGREQRIDSRYLDELRLRVSVPALAQKAGLKLRRAGRNWQALCPFHGDRNPSMTVYPDGFKCWSCGASGDAIRWMRDYEGMGFATAVADLAAMVGMDAPAGVAASAERTARRVITPLAAPVDDGPEMVGSIDVAREIWRRARNGGAGHPKWPVQTYLEARGVPRAVLGRGDILADLLFCPQAPIRPWRVGGRPQDVPSGPAMASIIRKPVPGDPLDAWPVIGLHVTWLSPDFTAKAARTSASGKPVPARKMLGDVLGGCVPLAPFRSGTVFPAAPLAVGEGIETVLSALAAMPADVIGMAALSLHNLQGGVAKDAHDALPLWNLRPDLESNCLRFRHGGPVTVLVDADMKPLKVQHNRKGRPIAPRVSESARGRWVIREVSQRERAEICAAVAVKGWQAAGCADVRAVRPAMGMDFNDAARLASCGIAATRGAISEGERA